MDNGYTHCTNHNLRELADDAAASLTGTRVLPEYRQHEVRALLDAIGDRLGQPDTLRLDALADWAALARAWTTLRAALRFDYCCETCGTKFNDDVRRVIKTEPLVCPECGGTELYS